MEAEQIRKWFESQNDKHECSLQWQNTGCLNSNTRVLKAWIGFNKVQSFTDFFGIGKDMSIVATLFSDCICIDMTTLINKRGFNISPTDIMPDEKRSENGNLN